MFLAVGPSPARLLITSARFNSPCATPSRRRLIPCALRERSQRRPQQPAPRLPASRQRRRIGEPKACNQQTDHRSAMCAEQMPTAKPFPTKSAETALRADAADRCFKRNGLAVICLSFYVRVRRVSICYNRTGIFPDPLRGCTIRKIPAHRSAERNRDANERVGHWVVRSAAAGIVREAQLQ